MNTLREHMETMRHELQTARAERQAARQERQEAREERAVLLHMLQEMQHRYDRLLEAPRPVSPVETPTAPVGSPTRPPSPTVAASFDRGTMRRRILALLEDHPEGLTPAQMRARLQVHKPLANTCTAMARDGLLRRLGQGRYAGA